MILYFSGGLRIFFYALLGGPPLLLSPAARPAKGCATALSLRHLDSLAVSWLLSPLSSESARSGGASWCVWPPGSLRSSATRGWASLSVCGRLLPSCCPHVTLPPLPGPRVWRFPPGRVAAVSTHSKQTDDLRVLNQKWHFRAHPLTRRGVCVGRPSVVRRGPPPLCPWL